MTARQIEAARRVIVREMKRRGKMWIRIFPDKPITAKPAETRMGKGKGSVDHWVAVIKPGRVMLQAADQGPIRVEGRAGIAGMVGDSRRRIVTTIVIGSP